jgi:UDP-galactopyranose mutase
MYDIVIIGAGISAATVCASLHPSLSICVLESRPSIGGNCYDQYADGSFIHKYGPHIFHSTSLDVVSFLSRFTTWAPITFRVEAEIEHDGRLLQVPFPYSRETATVLGRDLTSDEVIKCFFRGYSRKMWGIGWDELPPVIKGRVPKDTSGSSDYFPGQFVAMPKHGYTRMIENMFDGVDIHLGCGPNDWVDIPARTIIFCGRPDLIKIPGEDVTFGEHYGLSLPHRSLDINFADEPWETAAACKNFCSLQRPYTRKTSYTQLTGGHSKIVSTETPKQATADDLTPYYPIPLPENIERHQRLLVEIRKYYPQMIFCGRLATYKYLDMYQAVGQALAIVKRHFPHVAASGPLISPSSDSA